MRTVKVLGLILVGVAIGVSIGGVRPLRAEPTAPASRLSVTTGASEGPFIFAIVKDSKGTGCWLAAYANDRSITLTTAPQDACN